MFNLQFQLKLIKSRGVLEANALITIFKLNKLKNKLRSMRNEKWTMK